MTDPVLLERPAEGVALVRINRPDARNALNMEVRRLIAQHVTALGDETSVRCIVIAGNEKSFAAGADIKEMRYVLTGDLFGAREAHTMGLVSEVVPDADVEKHAIEIAKRIAELPPLAIELAKEAVLRGMDASLETGLALETKTIQLLFSS